MNSIIKKLKKSDESIDLSKVADLGSDGNLYIHSEYIKYLITQDRLTLLRALREEVGKIEQEALDRHQHDLKGQCDFERVETCRLIYKLLDETIKLLEAPQNTIN